MPTQCSRDLFGYEVIEGRQVVAAFDGGDATSDAGALLLGATDRAIGLVGRFAGCFDDGRVQAQVEHSIAAMVAQRVFGIALGYEDVVDHDQLRHDPVLATLAGKLEAKRKGCAPLAGKSTLNRLEHAPLAPSRYHKIGHHGAAIERLFVELFLEAHRAPPKQLISTWTLPTTRCMVIRRAGSSTATMTATAICRCTCSAAASCSQPNSGARTSTRRPVRSRRSSASWPRSGRAGPGSRSCCGRTPALPARR
jgi:hypothetical protein